MTFPLDYLDPKYLIGLQPPQRQHTDELIRSTPPSGEVLVSHSFDFTWVNLRKGGHSSDRTRITSHGRTGRIRPSQRPYGTLPHHPNLVRIIRLHPPAHLCHRHQQLSLSTRSKPCPHRGRKGNIPSNSSSRYPPRGSNLHATRSRALPLAVLRLLRAAMFQLAPQQRRVNPHRRSRGPGCIRSRSRPSAGSEVPHSP